MELSFEELRRSCEANGVTCLVCEQGFEDTMDDVVNEDPGIGLGDLKSAVMFRMLEENLDYGLLSEEDDEDDCGDAHSERLAARCDICDEVADRWIAGRYTKGNELEEAKADSRKLAEEKAKELE